MKKLAILVVCVLLVCSTLLLLSACTTKSDFYGTWECESDYYGVRKITINKDKTVVTEFNNEKTSTYNWTYDTKTKALTYSVKKTLVTLSLSEDNQTMTLKVSTSSYIAETYKKKK